jgi:cytochrome bd-type quinol oxidase subunit 2
MLNTILLDLHNILRWVILLALLYVLVKSWAAMNAKGTFSNGDRKAALILLISAHTTLLIGLYQWLFGQYGILSSSLPEGTVWIKDNFYRFFWLEHPVGMVVAITLITMGYSTIKKGTARAGLGGKAFWLLLAALLVLFFTIPWPWMGVGRPLFPGL